jgi:nucleotide-binding universal stress UspA family protein
MRTLMLINNFPLPEGVLEFSAEVISEPREGSTFLAVVPLGWEARHPTADELLDQTHNFSPFQNFQKKVRVGPLVKEVIDEAREGKYDILVIPTPITVQPDYLHPKPVLADFVEQAPCSVLAVKPPVSQVKRILLCDSGSDAAVKLRQFTARLIKGLDNLEELTILHVMSQLSAGPGIRGEQLRSDAENLIRSHTPEGLLLERDLLELDRAGVMTIPKIRHGLVVDEILEESTTGGYDLVIIGAHDTVGWQKLLLDNLARKILSQIGRSVLITKQAA